MNGLAGSRWAFSDEQSNKWSGMLSIQTVNGEKVYYAMLIIVTAIE